MLAVVSPYTHLAGHYASYTAQLAAAYKDATGDNAKILTSWNFSGRGMRAKACASWTRILSNASYRNRHWGSIFDIILRNLEFVFCLRAALKDPEIQHIYCLDARHRILFHHLHKHPKSFSHLCLGGPNRKQLGKDRLSYERAFQTDRLTFIVETEETLNQWKPIAGPHVVHIPVAIEEPFGPQVSGSEARNRYKIPQDRFVCLFFGTHRQGKDYHKAIKSAQLASSRPFLVFAGPVISDNDPARIVKELNYADALVLNRNFRDGEEADLFAACNAVVLPYVEGYTKGSAVLLQACKYGKPVIATDTGHFAEFIHHYHTGLLFTYQSQKSLAKCYDRLAFEDNQLMLQGISSARQTFTWNRLIHSYLDVFSGSPRGVLDKDR